MRQLSRNDFLKAAAVGIASVIAVSCGADDAAERVLSTSTPTLFPPESPTARAIATATKVVAPTADIRSLTTADAKARMCGNASSVEAIVKNGTRLADPVSDNQLFKEHMVTYNKILNEEILPEHTGPVLDISRGDLGIGSEILALSKGVKISVVASAYFSHEGKDVAMITLPVKSKDGSFSGIHVVLSPENTTSVKQLETTPDGILSRMSEPLKGSFDMAHVELTGNMSRWNTDIGNRILNLPDQQGLGQHFREAIIDGAPVRADHRVLIAVGINWPDGGGQ